MSSRNELPECPVATTLQLIGGKWKPYIVRNLLARPWRFNELMKDLDGISHKVLVECLREMELGESTFPIIQSMHDFGIYYKEIKSARENP